LRKYNVVANFLLRLTTNENEPHVEDYFPAEQFFAVYINSPWFGYIDNHLTIGNLPPHLSPKA